MPIKDDSLETYGKKHPVPQNVMDVEFKVVGDLTVRQFMYLVAGAALVFLFYKSSLPTIWIWIFIFITASISIAIAFVPIEERGMDIWLSNFVKAMFNPTQRIWKKTKVMPSYFLIDYSEKIKSDYALTPSKNRNKLTEFLGQINKSSEIDENEQARLSEINLALSATPSSSFVKENQAKAKKKAIQKELSKPNLADIMVDEINSKQEMLNSKTKLKPTSPTGRPLVNLPSQLKKQLKEKQTIKIKTTKPILKALPKATAKKKKLEIKPLPKKSLPEKTTNTKLLKKHGESLEQQVKELRETTKKAKEEFLHKPGSEKQKKNKIKFFNRKLFELKNEREKLNFKIHNKKNIETEKQNDKQIDNLKTKNKLLEKELEEIKKDLKHMKDNTKPSSKTAKSKDSDDDKTEDPKLIQGTVKDATGKLIESAVIIIKDKNGDVVRALKSNGLGAFKAQTPVDKGLYTIEVIKSGKSFDIISIEIGDEQLEPLSLVSNN